LISQLIAVAGVRMHSATARKLEPPLPAWFSEIADPPFRESVFDAIRFETAWSSATLRDDHWDVKFAQTGQKSNLLEATATKVTQPLIRWAFAENNRVIGQYLLALHGTDPCAIDTTKSTERIEANLSPLTRKLGAMATFALSNQATAISRAVIADVAVEGTNRILALKAARNADPQRAWPASFESGSSICTDARWAYQRGPDGTALLQFTGQVKLPPGFSGTKIPLEYRGSPPAKSVSGN
jgi:hypothetical protein